MTTNPARDPKTERWLDAIGAKWTFEPDLPLHRIDQAASLANQVRHLPLNEDVVEQYANDMRQGDAFPAVLVAPLGDQYALLGGNHRDAAHRKANDSTQPAYIIDADPTTLLRIRVEDNRNHGLPTTKAERLDHGVALVGSGITQRDAARIVGLPQPELSMHAGALNLAARLAGHAKADRVAKLARSKRYELSRINDDAVLAAAAELTVDAALPIDHVRAIVDQSNAASDTLEALRLIGQLRDDNEARITDQAGLVRASSRTARARLAESLTVIGSLDPQDVYDSCPNDDVRAVLAQRIMKAAAVLAPTHELLTARVAS